MTTTHAQLKRFEKVALGVGESVVLEFTLTIDDLLFYGLGDENVAKYEAGTFIVRIDNLDAPFTLVVV